MLIALIHLPCTNRNLTACTEEKDDLNLRSERVKYCPYSIGKILTLLLMSQHVNPPSKANARPTSRGI